MTPNHTGDGNVRADYVNSLDAYGRDRLHGPDVQPGLQPADAAKGWDDVTGVGVPTPAYLTSLGTK